MDRQKAITLAHPNCVSVFGENDAYDKDRNKIVLDEDKIKIEFDKLTAEFEATQYQRDREYPQIQEQLDMIYWDKKNNTKKWEEAIDKVKADNPKPEQ